jgi:hypothetical protein
MTTKQLFGLCIVFLLVLTPVSFAVQYEELDPGVEALLAKVYEKAAKNRGVVYDLGREIETPHPYDYPFSEYNQPLQPTGDNAAVDAYVEEVSQFLHEKCSTCKEIIIVGDDYVVPSGIAQVQVQEGFFSKLTKKFFYTDQGYAKRKFSNDFSQLDVLFTLSDDFEGKEVLFILPESMSPEQETSHLQLKQTLQEKFNPDMKEIEEGGVSCNDMGLFASFNDKTLIIIGTQENNNALNCYPYYNPETLEDSLIIDRNVWDKNEQALIIGTETQEGIHVLNHLIKTGTWKELQGQHLYIASSTISGASYILLFAGIGAAAVGAGSTGILAVAIPYADTGSDVLEIINDCGLLQNNFCKISMGMAFIPFASSKLAKKAYKQFIKHAGGEVTLKIIKKHGIEAYAFIGKLHLKSPQHVTSFAKAIKNSGPYWDEMYRLFKDKVVILNDVVAKGTRSMDDIPLTKGGRIIKQGSETTISINTAALGSEIISAENFVTRGARILKGENDIIYEGIRRKPVDYLMELGDDKAAVQVLRGFDSSKQYTIKTAREKISEKAKRLTEGINTVSLNDKWDMEIIHIIVPNNANKRIVNKAIQEIPKDTIKEKKIVISVLEDIDWVFGG